MNLKFWAVAAPLVATSAYNSFTDMTHTHISLFPALPVVRAEQQQEHNRMTLKHVQVVFRHGARTPISWSKERFGGFSNLEEVVWSRKLLGYEDLRISRVKYALYHEDSSEATGAKQDERHGKELEGGMMSGELTSVGKQMLYDFGKVLSRRYMLENPLLKSVFDKDEVYVRSTYYERTIQSLVSLLSGLYVDAAMDDVIRIQTYPIAVDDLMPNYHACRKYNLLLQKVFSGELKSAEEKEYEAQLNKELGLKNPEHHTYLGQWADLIRCCAAHHLPLPRILIDQEDTITGYEIHLTKTQFGDPSILRGAIGSLVETLCLRLEEAVEGCLSYKMLLYSGHDWTLIALLKVLGVELEEWPVFASHLIIELYEESCSGAMFVRVMYNDTVLKLGIEEDESGFAPVEKFLEKIESYRVVDLATECGNNDGDKEE